MLVRDSFLSYDEHDKIVDFCKMIRNIRMFSRNRTFNNAWLDGIRSWIWDLIHMCYSSFHWIFNCQEFSQLCSFRKKSISSEYKILLKLLKSSKNYHCRMNSFNRRTVAKHENLIWKTIFRLIKLFICILILPRLEKKNQVSIKKIEFSSFVLNEGVARISAPHLGSAKNWKKNINLRIFSWTLTEEFWEIWR